LGDKAEINKVNVDLLVVVILTGALRVYRPLHRLSLQQNPG